MTSCFRPSALALIAFAAVATSQPSRAQTLAGRPDRYGASASLSPVAPTALRSRYLTWPGKVTPTAPPALRAEFTAPSQPSGDDGAWRRAPTVAVDRRGVARIGAAQPPLWNPPAVASQIAAPTRSAWAQPPRAEASVLRVAEGHVRQTRPSIYDVPEPLGRDLPDPTRASAEPPSLRGRDDAPPQTQAHTQAHARPTPSQAQQLAFATPPRARPASGEGVRFYSVHRAFGLRPDPAPIPPQFFAATPDLSDPPGPITNRRVAAGSGLAARNAVQAQDSDATAQP